MLLVRMLLWRVVVAVNSERWGDKILILDDLGALSISHVEFLPLDAFTLYFDVLLRADC